MASRLSPVLWGARQLPAMLPTGGGKRGAGEQDNRRQHACRCYLPDAMMEHPRLRSDFFVGEDEGTHMAWCAGLIYVKPIAARHARGSAEI